MPQSYARSRVTWLMYLMLSFFGYLLNILGPITPFLMAEFNLSYTLSSMHFTAFAAGMILVGLGGHYFAGYLGRWNSLWIGAFGMCLATLMLIGGRSPAVTISACLLMGTAGSLIPVLVSSILSDLHGPKRAVALAEANFFAAAASALSPLLVGWFARVAGLPLAGWRLALLVVLPAPFFLRFGFGRLNLPGESHISTVSGNQTNRSSPLPTAYWLFWLAIVLAVSIEFCMIFWSADYLERTFSFSKAAAAQSVSLVLGGMILGRLAGSRIIMRLSEKTGVLISLAVLGLGFLLFWRAEVSALSLAGLFLTGLGIANLYPFILSLALETAGWQAVQASARASIASGVAILCLPMVLGGLADSFGIRPAYSVIMFLLCGLLAITLTVRRKSPAH